MSASVTLVTESTDTTAGLAVDWDEFDRLCATKGWSTDPQRAAGLGVGYQTLRHVRTGHLKPDGILLRRCLAVFGSKAYDQLFSEVA